MVRNTPHATSNQAVGGAGTDIAPFLRGRANQIDNADDDPMTIAEVAIAFGITPRALRFYEAKRLIAPKRQGAVRLYRSSDRERLALILTGRRLGFTLSEIGRLLERPGGKRLPLTREQCVTQINLLEQQKRGIENAIAELRRIYTSFYRNLLDGSGAGACDPTRR